MDLRSREVKEEGFDKLLPEVVIQAVVEVMDLPGRRLQPAIQMSRFAR